MKDIEFKVDLEDSLPANAFNSITSELENVVTASGQTLDNTSETTIDPNPTQVARAITQAALSASYYSDSSAAPNVIQLAVVGSWVQPVAYRDGARYKFKCAISNTGPANVSIAGIGVKSVVDVSGSSLVQGALVAGNFYELLYQLSGDEFILLNGSSPAGLNSPGPVKALKPVARFNVTGSVSVASSTTASILQFNESIADSHGAVTTGAAWAFVAPFTGYYRVSALVASFGTSGFDGSTEYMLLSALVVGSPANQRLSRYYYPRAAENSPSVSLEGIIYAVAGASIRVEIAQNSGVSLPILTGSASSVSIDLVEFA